MTLPKIPLDIFARKRFVVQPRRTLKSTLEIMDANMKTLCYVKRS